MKYYGLRVYDMAESIVASGLPMLKKQYTADEFEREVQDVRWFLRCFDRFDGSNLIKNHTKDTEYKTPTLRKAVIHTRRMYNLGGARPNSGHDCALKGILVNVNIKADQSFWLQWERYHHQDTVSSMSTMHCITKFDLNDNLFSVYTDERVLNILREKIEEYNANPTKENFHRVIHNCPEGIELTRRVSTNYLQLKTMYLQREKHKMFAWSEDFVSLCNELPLFKEFT